MELTCREFNEIADGYLSGELAPDQLEHCEVHLFQCPDCVQYYRSYRATIQLGKESLVDGDETTAEHLPQALARSILLAASWRKA